MKMNWLQKGLLLGAFQVAIVASLGAKLLVDRARLPRVWAKAAVYDPDLPIRGRYLALQLAVRVDAPNKTDSAETTQGRRVANNYFWGTLRVEDGQLVLTPSSYGVGVMAGLWHRPNQPEQAVLQEPVLFFLPEHAENPWTQAKNGEIWAEVTVPKKGPPRPIRLAVKRGDSFTPLNIK